MEILNRTELGKDCKNRQLGLISRVIVHRNSVGENVDEIYKFFKENPNYTGGKIPYHFFVYKDGTIVQTIPLSKIGFAALAANAGGIQVCGVGDFRTLAPSVKQYESILWIVTQLCKWIGRPVAFGHDEIPEAMGDEKKVCPGHLINMNEVRKFVSEHLTKWPVQERDARIYKLGVIL
jgi:hypothetical protein